MKPTVAVFDTKTYDREHLTQAPGADEVDWQFHEFRLNQETAFAAKGAYAACVFVNDSANRDALTRLAEFGVRLVALRCTGFNNVDLDAAKELGIQVVRAASYSPYSVAEHTVALILALNRKIHRAYNRVRELNFSLNGLVGFDLNGKTAGIVGTGKIGRIVGQILRGFGMRVLAYDPYPNTDWAAQYQVQYVEPRRLAHESDVITLHVPLTPETKHVIRRETIEVMKPGVMLVNVSRGQLIDTTALIGGLKEGLLGGVALDVYEEEEGIFFEDLSGRVLQDDVLARMLTFHNVIITAHQAFLTQEALNDIARVTVGNVLRSSRKEPLLEGTVLSPSRND
jgi:D-lactate dehydrogenase